MTILTSEVILHAYVRVVCVNRYIIPNYKFLKEKEQAICVEVEALLQHAKACDAEDNAAYQERIGYELPVDLAFKQRRLRTIKAAKKALKARRRSAASRQDSPE